jgi:hypothetical protein
MALPGSYKKKINITQEKIGIERREEMKEMVTDKQTFLPKGLLIEDLDLGFKSFIENDLNIVVKGKKVPTRMLSTHLWSEFAKTWEYSDRFKNIKIPFISIVKQPTSDFGTYPSLKWNIPQGRAFTYCEVPTFEDGKKGMDIYKIPQPIPIDIDYEVRFFTYRQREVNIFTNAILKKFQARQAYAVINGHYIPITYDEVESEASSEDLESNRYYVQLYKFKLSGFILDPNDFELIPSVRKVVSLIERG